MNPFRVKSIEEITLSSEAGEHRLVRSLRAKDLVFLGIGAVIGAGIFSTLGTAAVGEPGVRDGAGPALVLSFVLLGAVCALCGLCYAELTSMIPVAGSAYTYAFATLGELAAWIIGWDLILEYAVGNVAVAISWSAYFCHLVQPPLAAIGLALPDWLVLGFGDVQQKIAAATNGGDLAEVARLKGILDSAPNLIGWPLVINLPAVLIVLSITWLLVRGVRESARANNVLVLLKLLVLGLFIAVGAYHVNPENWHPFAPNGWSGIHQGAAIVFFAYIGFDAISTAAEETVEPQRAMPIGILGALGICTVIYILIGLVATGLVPYTELGGGADPLARALDGAGLHWLSFVVAVGAVISTAAVLLVFQLGQPRIFFAMARDGLLPRSFARVHARYRTPHLTTIATGLIVAVGAALMDDDATYDLTNIGTLFAFLIACVGVMILRVKKPDQRRGFRVPFVWIVAPLGAAACVYTMTGLPRVAWERFGIWLGLGLAIYFGRAAFRRREAA